MSELVSIIVPVYNVEKYLENYEEYLKKTMRKFVQMNFLLSQKKR